MLDTLLTTAVDNAKLALAAVAGAALVAGGSAVAFQQVSDETPSTSVTVSTSDDDDANEAAEHRSDTATADVELPKPSKSPKAESGSDESEAAQGVHGACVSAVAKDKSTVGREHGKAVSAAAHSCPKGDHASKAGSTVAESDGDEDADTDADDADEDDADADDADEVKPAKSAKPAKRERGRSAQHESSDD